MNSYIQHDAVSPLIPFNERYGCLILMLYGVINVIKGRAFA